MEPHSPKPVAVASNDVPGPPWLGVSARCPTVSSVRSEDVLVLTGGLGVLTDDGLGALTEDEGEDEDGVGLSASAGPPVSVATKIAHTDASAPAAPRQKLRGPCPRGLRAVDRGVIRAVSRLSRVMP